MSVTITADALPRLADYLERSPARAREAARLSINDVAGGSGLKLLRDAVQDEAAFPARYVDKSKLYLARKAYNNRLEAVIAARTRPTSLARFAVPGQTPLSTRREKGVRVQVHHGATRRMSSAFLVRLRAGNQVSDEAYNLGLAIRLKPGERIINKRQQSAVQLDHNLYLLYGPSVDQVFREIASEQSPAILDKVESEFYRQFVRLGD